jgi:hypothetical protein
MEVCLPDALISWEICNFIRWIGDWMESRKDVNVLTKRTDELQLVIQSRSSASWPVILLADLTNNKVNIFIRISSQGESVA